MSTFSATSSGRTTRTCFDTSRIFAAPGSGVRSRWWVLSMPPATASRSMTSCCCPRAARWAGATWLERSWLPDTLRASLTPSSGSSAEDARSTSLRTSEALRTRFVASQRLAGWPWWRTLASAGSTTSSPSLPAPGWRVSAYHADHSAEQRLHYAALAAQMGLLATGGSDFHGDAAPNPPLGSVDIPDEAISALWQQGRTSARANRATLPRAMQTYLIRTFGCQMNKHDSERVAGLLRAQSMSPVEEAESADVIVFMTCCVRENADERLRGQVASLKALKPARGQGPLIAVGGCIGQRDGERLLEQLPHVDVVFGTHNIAHLPALLEAASARRTPQIEILEESTEFASDLPAEREHPWHAWVPITVGCDNYCTYCVVPYVRGREKSRALTTSCTRSSIW